MKTSAHPKPKTLAITIYHRYTACWILSQLYEQGKSKGKFPNSRMYSVHLSLCFRFIGPDIKQWIRWLYRSRDLDAIIWAVDIQKKYAETSKRGHIEYEWCKHDEKPWLFHARKSINLNQIRNQGDDW